LAHCVGLVGAAGNGLEPIVIIDPELRGVEHGHIRRANPARSKNTVLGTLRMARMAWKSPFASSYGKLTDWDVLRKN